VVRRADGTPAVIENAPFLDDGRPMPTRFWLVDAALRDAVSRLEAAGGVRAAAAAVDPAAIAEAHARHAAGRDRSIPAAHRGPRPSGGVGGTRRGVKCLHAHIAWYLAGGDDPVGRWVAGELALDLSGYVVAPGVAGAVVERVVVDAPLGPVAAVDCGTNSTRLLVVGPDGGVLDRRMRITRLGEGVDATHRLASGAVERTLAVLREYREVMDRFGVVRARVVATSAARDAENARAFLDGAAEVTGSTPEVLGGLEEGRLSFAGATAHLPAGVANTGAILVVDIGGGSTELVAGTVPAPGVAGPAVTAVSLDVGCVRGTERFVHHDPPRAEELRRARREVDADVARARAVLPELADGPLIGLAGTVSTLAALELGLAEYDRSRVHHAVLARRDVDRWVEVLAGEDSAARLARPGMVEGRADVIVSGALILAAVMAGFDRGECLVSEDDILDGMAAGLLAAGPG
jgi:exopolyphosphatase/guanosine-5'-triphosphate,3'-diphosphate pyrophosphatase